MESSGVDPATGQVYANPQELWDVTQQEAQQPGATQWYIKAVDYWDEQDPTDDGVLGGYGEVSKPDIQDSKQFLVKAFGSALNEAKEGKRHLVALDCGAGVGRVSENLLLHHFQEVDLVEPSEHLLKAAQQRLCGSSPKPFPKGHRAVGFFQMGLQDFKPEPQRYDVIWVQWALLYLTDDDAVAFFQRCMDNLKPGGLIFVKENVCQEGFIVDKDDASLTRSHQYMVDLFSRSGLYLMHTALQKNFPKGLFKVRMYALKSKSR